MSLFRFSRPLTMILPIWLGIAIAVAATPALADGEFSPSSVKKGVVLVASPSLTDPNFSETVVLVIEHGDDGTLGVILNRALTTPLSEAMPEIKALEGTSYKLFAGGPVEISRLVLLFRSKDRPPSGAQSVFDSVYFGGTPATLERIITEGKPKESFRVFAGVSGWAPGQLSFEMGQGAWGVLPAESIGIFDHDASTLWRDCISRLQAPRVIAH